MSISLFLFQRITVLLLLFRFFLSLLFNHHAAIKQTTHTYIPISEYICSYAQAGIINQDILSVRIDHQRTFALTFVVLLFV